MPEAGGAVVVAWSQAARIGAELRDARAVADRRSTEVLGIDHPHRRNPRGRVPAFEWAGDGGAGSLSAADSPVSDCLA